MSRALPILRPILRPNREHEGRGARILRLALLVSSLGVWLLAAAACRPGNDAVVVVYAAQDRVFAEPVLREFTRRTGIEVRAVYDNEATKTTGLVQRLLMEAQRPQADVWWSNEAMRTHQLVARGVLEAGVVEFGRRERVWVTRRGQSPPDSVRSLTNAVWRGRCVIAYPVFGSTANHLLVLRQRWGSDAWQAWCRALSVQRPLMVDGNSKVVRAVADGLAEFGLTDSDDVAFAQREGLDVLAHRIPAPEAMALPNTAAVVVGARHREAARALIAHLASAEVVEGLRKVGAVDAQERAGSEVEAPIEWPAFLADLDAALDVMASIFTR